MSSSFALCSRTAAEAALAACVPNASISPDRLFEAAQNAGLLVSFTKIEEFDSLSKEQLFDKLFSDQELPDGRGFVISDDLLPSSSAFTFEGPRLREAVVQERRFLFDGDLIFVWPSLGFVTVFHHEGGYFHVRSPAGLAHPSMT